jgi:DNA-binding transcriptional LysR family regulator
MALGIDAPLRQGRLIELLPQWRDETFRLYAYHALRLLPSARVRAFLDFIIKAT